MKLQLEYVTDETQRAPLPKTTRIKWDIFFIDLEELSPILFFIC